MNLLMISGKGASETAQGKRNAFYNTLEELHKYFNRIDVVTSAKRQAQSEKLFGNVFFHSKVPHVKFDVMTVHEYAPFRNGRLANKILKTEKIPVLFEIMHIPGVPRAGSWREYAAKLLMRYYIKHDTRHATAIRVINQQIGDWLVAAGISPAKIKLIPAMYIDLNIFKPMDLEKKYDLIFVGRRAKNKGIGLFTKAIDKLQITNYKIVDGWAKDASEVAHLINQSRILVMPSYNEGGPRVVLEALACGVPVLATPVGIVPEILPPEWIIDWSVEDIIRKAKKILSGNFVFPRINMQQFEKKSAIKYYADAIRTLI